MRLGASVVAPQARPNNAQTASARAADRHLIRTKRHPHCKQQTAAAGTAAAAAAAAAAAGTAAAGTAAAAAAQYAVHHASPSHPRLRAWVVLASMKRILLIRHGQCDMNLTTTSHVGGQSNSSPLTPLGQRQAAALGQHLHQAYPALHSPVFCSTAVRARDTATIMLQQWPQEARPPVVMTEQLLELSQGEWEGRLRTECYTPEMLAAIRADPWHFAAPGGESQRQLEERVAAFVNQHVLGSLAYGGPPALIVTHGLAIKCFLRGVLGSEPSMTWKVALDNTAVTEVAWCATGPAAGWHLRRVNDTAHLVVAGLPGA